MDSKKLRSLLLGAMVLPILSGCTWGTLNYFPAVTGKISHQGKPVKDAKVVFKLNQGYVRNTSQLSDAQGRFSIPLATRTGIIGPHAHIAEVEITIEYQGKTYLALAGKRDYLEDQDVEKFPLFPLYCELTNPNKQHQVKDLNGNAYTTPEEQYFHYQGICTYRPASN